MKLYFLQENTEQVLVLIGFKGMETGDIIKKYITYVAEKGSKPINEHVFAKYLKIAESKFYTFYPNLAALEEDIWANTLTNTVDRLGNDENYVNFSSREKLLSYYFTFIEELNENRSFYRTLLKEDISNLKNARALLKKTKASYVDFVGNILQQARNSGEIKSRMFLDNKYNDLLYFQFLFVLGYWYKDQSKGFEHTDEAIEKAVNLSFELMAGNLLDSLVDFARFIKK